MVVNYDAQASQHIFQELGEQRRNNFCTYRGKKISILKTSTVYHYMGLLVSGIILKIR
jgi:hypothetical protein